MKRKRIDDNSQESDLQKEAIERAVTKRENLLITGSGGVGKSFIVNTIRDRLTKQGFNVHVTASTGIAACPLSGITLHSWMGLGLAKEENSFLINRARKNSRTRTRWIETDTLIVDEISMVTPRTLDILDQVGRVVRKRHGRPFGGIQIICVGDFAQLPPVSRTDEALWRGLKFVFQHPEWTTYFPKTNIIHLTHNFRQTDTKLKDKIDRLRFATHDHEDSKFWTSQIRSVPSELDSLVTKLFPTNAEADKVNKTKLLECCPDESKHVVFESCSTGDKKNPAVQAFLNNMEKSCLARQKVHLATGARVMLLCNLNPAKHLVNGTCGSIVGWTDPVEVDPFPRQCYPLVQFDLPDQKKSGKIKILPHAWEYQVKQKILGAYHQIPLQLCYAITIHKSQGMTLEKMSINLSNMFECGQAYTGISRMKSLEGLWLTGFDPNCVKVNPLVSKFYRDL